MRARREAGFTIVELVIVIAVMGVLAAIALPALMDSKRKITSASEVNQFFTELRVRQNQWFAENGVYKETGTGETDTYPAAPDPDGQDLDLAATMPQSWKDLKIKFPTTNDVRCAYVVIVGGNATGTVGARATALGFVAPAKSWFYMLARCNADNDTSTDAFFISTSENTEIKSSNVDR